MRPRTDRARRPRLWLVPVTLGALLLASGAAASPKPLRFTHVRVEDGLSNGWVRAVLKDSQGFLWFGTADGLDRYDGRHIRVFRHDPQDPASLPGSHVTSLLEDARGRLWIGLSGPATGLALYDRKTDRFRHVPLDTRPAPPHAADVRQLLQDRAGRIWVAASGGLYRLSTDERGFTRVWGGKSDSPRLVDHEVYRAVEDRQGSLWLACGLGLVRVDPETGASTRWSMVLDGVSVPSAEGVTEVYIDARGFLWFVSDGVGLVRLDPSSGQVRRYPSGTGPGALPAERPRRLIGDGRGHIYVGSEDAGLAVLDVQTGHFHHYVADPDDPDSLSAPSVWALYRDDEGVLWVGTFNGGVDAASPRRSRFGVLTARPGQLTSPSVAAVLEDRSGGLWIGTDGGGLVHRSAETGGLSHYRHDPQSAQGLASNSVLALLQDDSGRIWIGTWGGGIQELDPASGRFAGFHHVPGDPESLDTEHVFALLKDSTGALLVGGPEGGVRVLDRAGRHFGRLSDRYPGIGVDAVHALAEDAMGNLWIGEGDAEYLDRETGVVTHHRLGAGSVFAIHPDRLGNVWFATQSRGLACLDAGTRQLRWFTTADGLPSNRVTSIQETADGSLWLGTGRGIARFQDAVRLPDSPRLVTYDVRDGLSGDEFREGASFQSASGELYFGGPSGLTFFDPRDFGTSRAAPRATLSGLGILGRSVAFGDAGVDLDAALGEARRLVLSPDQTMVHFEYAALEYDPPGKLSYRHQLVGFDDGWSPPSPDNSATYTNLPPGRYRFRVAVGGDGEAWSEDALSLEVVRRAALWERNWFRAALALLGIAGAFGIHRLRVRRHLRTERRLQARVEDAMAELKTLSGLLPICAWCRRVRNDEGYWGRIESFVKERSEAEFTDSLCPTCAAARGVTAATTEAGE